MGAREPVITIDGPAGAGKSTVARMLAKRLGFMHLDSGSLYRMATWLLLRDGVRGESDITGEREEAVLRVLQGRELEVRIDSEGIGRLHLGDADITADVRSPEVDDLVGLVARRRRIRDAVTALQRDLIHGRHAVVEGRDAGTVVFPDARVKFFLTASIRARAQRRFLETRRTAQAQSLASLIRSIETRDALDSNRELAPLHPARDAVIVDTSGRTATETVSMLLEHVEKCAPDWAHGRMAVLAAPAHLIAVSGPIGVGKSSFCRWLGDVLSTPVFAEDPDSNPYIRAYYAEPARWALHSQMWFLYRKHELLSAICDQKASAIIDRTLYEDHIFARLLLERDDLELYEHWYNLVSSLAPHPALLVSLEAPAPILLQRIAQRGRAYEQGVAPAFIETLNAEYNVWVSRFADAPVLRIDTSTQDVHDESVRAEIADEIGAILWGDRT